MKKEKRTNQAFPKRLFQFVVRNRNKCKFIWILITFLFFAIMMATVSDLSTDEKARSTYGGYAQKYLSKDSSGLDNIQFTFGENQTIIVKKDILFFRTLTYEYPSGKLTGRVLAWIKTSLFFGAILTVLFTLAEAGVLWALRAIFKKLKYIWLRITCAYKDYVAARLSDKPEVEIKKPSVFTRIKNFFSKAFEKLIVGYDISKFCDAEYWKTALKVMFFFTLIIASIYGTMIKPDMSSENENYHAQIMQKFISNDAETIKEIHFKYEYGDIVFTLDKRIIPIVYYKYSLSDCAGKLFDNIFGRISLSLLYGALTISAIFVGWNTICYLLHIAVRKKYKSKLNA